jgi:hypothetical protein
VQNFEQDYCLPSSAVDRPEVLARARHQIAHITEADTKGGRIHGWHVASLGWLAALYAEDLISEDALHRLRAEANAAKVAREAALDE